MATSLQVLFGDLVRTFAGGTLGPSTGTDGVSLTIPLQGVKLLQFAHNERFSELDRQESWFRKRAHAHKRYEWDGSFAGYQGEKSLPVGYAVPYSNRRPAARYDVAAIIVNRYTALLFGDRFPEIVVPGDDDAEDWVKELAKAASFESAVMEDRNLAGAVGTGCTSFCYVDGKPRVEIHNAKHCTVLEWKDEAERRVSRVLKTYAYPRQVWDSETQQIVTRTYYYARYWDESIETVWEPIPDSIAKLPNWSTAIRSTTVTHGWGLCPFYWTQNMPDSECPDGIGDYDGLEENFNEIDQLLSASTSGTKANVDPTLVVNMEPAKANAHPVRKGSGQAIFSPGGASYLELSGQAVQAAIAQLDKLAAYTLSAADVVLADPEKLAGAAQSAAALRLLYAPMLARGAILRKQWGERCIVPMLRDMLRTSKMVLALEPVIDENGQPYKMGLSLPDRVETSDSGEATMVPRKPGTSENIELVWGPWFEPTWTDIQAATTAAKLANGDKPIISQKTSIAAVQTMWGVSDVDAELKAIEQDADAAMEREAKSVELMNPPDLEGGDEGDDAVLKKGPPKKAE